MDDRTSLIDRFLTRAGWGDATRAPLAGDASNRRYERISRASGKTVVLMDAPPDRGESVAPFLRIADHLSSLGLSPPEILAEDREAGLLLLEDLGDALYARLFEAGDADEAPLYTAAVDLLVELQRHPVPVDAPQYGPEQLLRTAGLSYDWYLAGIKGRVGLAEKIGFASIFGPLLAKHVDTTDVLVLRDYHAENLIWRPERKGIARVGLLDFQDAAAGHEAYDLVSLLKDVRRDVDPEVERDMLARFLALSGHDAADFRAAYALLGAQRNLRILGIFSRLSLNRGKPQYIDLIPRVWAHLTDCLAHPALAPLARRIEADLPPPEPRHLETLREKCGTVRTP